jgi:TPR repeat protein
MTQRLSASCCGLALLASCTIALAADATSDIDMAARYSAAASAGDDRAQFYLGALYSAGVGVTESDAEAFHWVALAAQQGHSQAMLVLAGLLAIGRGTPKDNVAAFKWAYIVSEGSLIVDLKNGAGQLLSLLETRMNAAEIARAKSDALAFRAAKPSTVAPAAPAPAAANVTNPAPPLTATVSQPARAATSKPAHAPNAEEVSADRDPPKSGHRSDIDRLLDNVPTGIRKRYGF